MPDNPLPVPRIGRQQLQHPRIINPAACEYLANKRRQMESPTET